MSNKLNHETSVDLFICCKESSLLVIVTILGKGREKERENASFFSLLSSLILMRTKKVTSTRSMMLSCTLKPTCSLLNENVRFGDTVIVLGYF